MVRESLLSPNLPARVDIGRTMQKTNRLGWGEDRDDIELLKWKQRKSAIINRNRGSFPRRTNI